jgi:uncharacterized protein YceH (UPF0502 family)
VLAATEVEVQAAIDRLKPLTLVIESSGSRVMRYSHNVGRVLKLSSEAVALLATLWLRGPQTAAELRAWSERLHRFADVSSVEGFLQQLADRPEEAGGPLVALLPRAAGEREQRWAQLLTPLPVDNRAARPAGSDADAVDAAAPWKSELDELRAELAELRSRVGALEERQR